VNKDKIRYSTLALGLIVALAIVISNLFAFNIHKTDSPQKQQQEQSSQDDDHHDEYFSLASTNIPTSIHIEVTSDVVCLFEILFEQKGFSKEQENIAVPINLFLVNLLGAIISPNAP
jgi:hypothetical protein